MTDEQRKQTIITLLNDLSEPNPHAKCYTARMIVDNDFEMIAESIVSASDNRIKELESALTDITRILPSKSYNPYYETDIAHFLVIANKILTSTDNDKEQKAKAKIRHTAYNGMMHIKDVNTTVELAESELYSEDECIAK